MKAVFVFDDWWRAGRKGSGQTSQRADISLLIKTEALITGHMIAVRGRLQPFTFGLSVKPVRRFTGTTSLDEVKDVLFENEQYLDGYIIGLLDALDIPNRHRCCHSGFTGTITGLPHDKAEKLAGLIADKLIPLCEARKKQIKHYNNLPHVKYHREKEQSQTQ